MEILKNQSNDTIKTESKNNEYPENYGRFYLKSNLEYFINKTAIPNRERSDDGGWRVLPDKESNLKRLLVQHIVRNYTIKQVYTVFYLGQAYTSLLPGYISSAKELAYMNIDDEDSFSWEEKQKLERRVMGMPPAQFGLMVDFILESGLFWDDDIKEEVYLDIG